jgi:hypothetical protein
VDIPNDVLEATVAFMRNASAIYHKEEDRREGVLVHLEDALQFPFTRVINHDATSPDNIILIPLRGNIKETAAVLLNEDKRDFGDGGSDPSTQASLSMVRFWAQQNVCASKII